MPERLDVQRAVAASAGEIFAVLTDPRGHVAIDSSGMLMEASGDLVAKAGDTFVVHMDREALNDYPLGLYDVTVEIVTFEPAREIAWTVKGQLNLGHVYGYKLEPIDGGTLVTSYYDWSAAEQSWKDAAIFPVIPESALRATLGILARTVAPGKPRPALPNRLLPCAPEYSVACQAATWNRETVSDVPERWTNASVYPDMWADPGEDPRNSEGVSPDGELATLQDYVRNYRLTLLMKCEGLDPGQLARRSVPPSTMSLLGLIRHLAEGERSWRNWIAPADPAPKLYGAGDAAFEGAAAEQALADGAFADLAREQAATDAVLTGYPDLGTRLGRKAIAVREVWVHRIDEYARHCGHADLLRERIDGRVGQ